jgi:hypothetical protein
VIIVVTADIWVDPACPWTWLTARWLLEVERVRDVRARFCVMSLAVLNEASPPPGYDVALYWQPVRVLTAADLSLGEPAVRALYITLAPLMHEEGPRAINRDLFALALHRAGLPHSLANAAFSPYYDEQVRARHAAAVAPVGPGLGSPIIHLGQSGFFGPVIGRCPRGEAAGILWDSVALAARSDTFYELKRGRTGKPVFD